MSCCPTGRTMMHCDYQCKGSVNASTKSYVVRPSGTPSRAIVLLPDIFGMSAQSMYVADVLSERLNATIVYPDIWDGKPWLLENFPPKEGQDLLGWIKSAGDYPGIQKAKIIAAIDEAKATGVPADKIGGIGFCYGAKLAAHALRDSLFVSIAGVHPAFYGADDFSGGLKGAVCVIASQNEDKNAMDAIEAVITKDATFGEKSKMVHFPTMHHGFMAARADFKDAENFAELNKGLDILVSFYESTL